MVVLFLTLFLGNCWYCYYGDNMQVKLFDEEDEVDLEMDINEFLSLENIDVVDIKYQVGVSIFSDEQIYCFSAMIIYRNFDWKYDIIVMEDIWRKMLLWEKILLLMVQWL